MNTRSHSDYKDNSPTEAESTADSDHCKTVYNITKILTSVSRSKTILVRDKAKKKDAGKKGE